MCEHNAVYVEVQGQDTEQCYFKLDLDSHKDKTLTKLTMQGCSCKGLGGGGGDLT